MTFSADVAYAGTSFGVLKSCDGGATWGDTNAGLIASRAGAIAIDPSASTTVFAGVLNGGVFKGTNGGNTWSATGLTSTSAFSFVMESGTLFAGTAEGVLVSINGGSNWSANHLTSVQNVQVHALAVGSPISGHEAGDDRLTEDAGLPIEGWRAGG